MRWENDAVIDIAKVECDKILSQYGKEFMIVILEVITYDY